MAWWWYIIIPLTLIALLPVGVVLYAIADKITDKIAGPIIDWIDEL